MTPVPVPVLVLAGGLGAGKTTLLNTLLTAATGHGRRVAVIENEFGEVGIDAELLAAPRAQVVELANGCACCTLQGQLATALTELAGRRDALDALLVEASGVADPGPVLRAFVAHDVRDAFAIKTLVTVIDATAPLADLTAHPAASRQVRFADRFALTKTEQRPDAVILALRQRLGELNPHAEIEQVGDVGRRLDRLFEPTPARSVPSDAHVHDATSGHGFTAVAVTVDGSLDPAALDQWLAGLLAAADGRLARVKGILAVSGDDRRYVIQGVRDQITTERASRWRGPRRSRLVLIGHRLDREALQAGLAACQAHDNTRAA